ncbi:MAG: nucleotidyltransferase domain-containing protein [Bacteroidales bacterium]|nr:nucleotidyltransferase domain-containing protein [Bacteroidales bacterium]
MYGLTDRELALMDSYFSQIANLEKVILYGSRAKGNYKKFSDVDITLLGKEIGVSDLFKLQDLLYESDLPYMYDVSLFKSLTNPDLIDHINRKGVVLWERKVS